MCEQFQMGRSVLPDVFRVVIDAFPSIKSSATLAAAGYCT
jgi:hypothetical protein